jgi:hypothetical protein
LIHRGKQNQNTNAISSKFRSAGEKAIAFLGSAFDAFAPQPALSYATLVA